MGSSMASSAEMQNGHGGPVWQHASNASNTPTPMAPSPPSSFGGGVTNGQGSFPSSLPNVGLRYRPDSIRPPPPERRNSTITGTPFIYTMRSRKKCSFQSIKFVELVWIRARDINF